MKILIKILICVLVALSACPTWAEVITSSDKEYYTITGASPRQIINSIQRNSDIDIKGKTASASALPKFNVTYSWQSNGRFCRITDVTVRIHTTFRYPKLTTTSLNSQTQKWWDKTLSQMEQHELGHEAIAITYAHQIQDKLVRKSFGCKRVKKKVEMFIKRILREMNVKQAAYESQTAHGLAQDNYKGIASIPFI